MDEPFKSKPCFNEQQASFQKPFYKSSQATLGIRLSSLNTYLSIHIISSYFKQANTKCTDHRKFTESVSVKNVTALPGRPALPVRPISRCRNTNDFTQLIHYSPTHLNVFWWIIRQHNNLLSCHAVTAWQPSMVAITCYSLWQDECESELHEFVSKRNLNHPLIKCYHSK